MGALRQTAFWDREVDRHGNVIRPDVRVAAQQVWTTARAMACSLLGDASDAAEVLESSVARVSRYLDARNVTLFSQRTNALLLVAFRNALYSLLAKRKRTVVIDLAEHISDCTWERKIEVHLDFAKLLRCLSERSRMILLLRHAGYEWNQIATLLQITIPAAKNGLWRELRRLQIAFANSASEKIAVKRSSD